jgi:hypothetical protein
MQLHLVFRPLLEAVAWGQLYAVQHILAGHQLDGDSLRRLAAEWTGEHVQGTLRLPSKLLFQIAYRLTKE